MGVFAYKAKGKFPSNFVMEAVDVFLVAKGSAAEVGYKVTPELMLELDDAGLLEDGVYRALIHSHHGMSTTFSGTDHEQLKLAAQSNPYYLSVVVNNALEFTAKVAIESKEVLNGYSYFKTPNNKEVKTPKTYTKKTYEVIEVEVECQWPDYMLTVDEQIKNIQKYSPVPAYNSYASQPSSYSHNQNYRNSYQKRDAWELPLHYYDAPKSVPASQPAVAEQEDEYELYSQHLEAITEALKAKKLDYKRFADVLLETCNDVGIPYEFLWEYMLTETVVSEDFDNKVVEYLEPIIYKTK